MRTGFKKLARMYVSGNKEPFKVSRSKIDLFLNCSRCFYLDARLGIKRPEFPAFTLNSAVDVLLKKEFDIHRAKGSAHPLMKKYGIAAVPFAHKDIDVWRHNFTGVQHLHRPTNLLVFGAIDDVWQDENKELYVVDYKSTSKDRDPDLEGPWQQGFKRQMEVYQWLLRRNGFDVSHTGYFVYANGRKDREAFDGRLEFDVIVIPYTGKDDWVEPTLERIKETLDLPRAPKAGSECEYCRYVDARAKAVTPAVSEKVERKDKPNSSSASLF